MLMIAEVAIATPLLKPATYEAEIVGRALTGTKNGRTNIENAAMTQTRKAGSHAGIESGLALGLWIVTI
jgi:hypothetical protein